MTINIKSTDEIAIMKRVGQMTSQVLDMVENHVNQGVTTEHINQVCHDFIVNTLEAIPAPLNYHGFPKSICTSVNHVVCHGIPGPKLLKNGDIVNIDITIIKEGFHGDASRMFTVGKPSVLANRLINISYECLQKGIELVRPGVTLGDIGATIQAHAESNGFSIVREYCGHGIGRGFHEEPQILHYGKPNTGLKLEAGMTFTIEPMLNVGRPETRILADGWTVVTKDHSLSAQWEHTLAVTDYGVEILTAVN